MLRLTALYRAGNTMSLNDPWRAAVPVSETKWKRQMAASCAHYYYWHTGYSLGYVPWSRVIVISRAMLMALSLSRSPASHEINRPRSRIIAANLPESRTRSISLPLGIRIKLPDAAAGAADLNIMWNKWPTSDPRNVAPFSEPPHVPPRGITFRVDALQNDSYMKLMLAFKEHLTNGRKLYVKWKLFYIKINSRQSCGKC